MKRYTLKLAIAFLITYVLLMVVVVFAYTQISNNFIVNQAEQNLSGNGTTITNRINAQFDFDYDKLENLINGYLELSLDPVEQLNLSASTLYVQDQNYLGFGLLADRDLMINGETYTYVQDFLDSTYRQKLEFIVSHKHLIKLIKLHIFSSKKPS